MQKLWYLVDCRDIGKYHVLLFLTDVPKEVFVSFAYRLDTVFDSHHTGMSLEALCERTTVELELLPDYGKKYVYRKRNYWWNIHGF